MPHYELYLHIDNIGSRNDIRMNVVNELAKEEFILDVLHFYIMVLILSYALKALISILLVVVVIILHMMTS